MTFVAKLGGVSTLRPKATRLRDPPPHSGPIQWVTLHVLEIKKISQCIVNNVNLSVLKLEKRPLHKNGVEFYKKLIGNQYKQF